MKHLLLLLLLLLLLNCVQGVPVFRGKQGEERATADIYWDIWGVPHIFADSFESLSHAFGYAQARDHGELITRMMFLSSGRAAELAGPIYSLVDRLTYSFRLRQLADQFYELQDPESVIAYDNFAAGFNQFAEENPQYFIGDFSLILPATGIDFFRANFRVVYIFTFASMAGFFSGFQEKFGEDPTREKYHQREGVYYSASEMIDLLDHLGIPPEIRKEMGSDIHNYMGSNGWAINSRSGKTDGKTKLNQNPHLSYMAFFKWYEAQLTCEACGINVYGATLVGIPNLQIAFNDYLGWTHTVNTHQAYTGYYVEAVGEDSYLYDGQVYPIRVEEVTYRVKLPIGYRTETVINEYTLHGQIVGRGEGVLLVKRLAGMDDTPRPDLVKQWWDLCRSRSMEEFKYSMRQLQISMFNTIVASRDDDILYNFNGWVPLRQSGDWNYWAEPVNGSTSETFWDQLIPWDDLPSLENPISGYVQNANEPPWTATLPVYTLNPANYPAYIAPGASMGFRPQISTRMMSTNFNITYEQFVTLKHSTGKESATHCLDDLLKAVQDYGSTPEVFEAADVLSSWDRAMDTTSRGSILYEAWISVSPPASQLYLNPWNPSDPLNTPNTLRDPQGAVADLDTAVRNVRLRGIEIDTPYGDVNRLLYDLGEETLPGNGCSDCFRNAGYSAGVANFGDSYVGVVEWDRNGIVDARTCIGYGNASPGTKGAELGHLYDQNLLFSRKELKTVWMNLRDILPNLEEHVSIALPIKMILF